MAVAAERATEGTAKRLLQFHRHRSVSDPTIEEGFTSIYIPGGA